MCWSADASANPARHDELIARKGLYYAMWRQQVGEGRASLLPQGMPAGGQELSAAWSQWIGPETLIAQVESTAPFLKARMPAPRDGPSGGPC